MNFSRASKTAVIIPVFNARDRTLACLRHLASGETVTAHVIVVDDGSTDGTTEAIVQEFPDVSVLQGDGALWWSGAVDLGCRFAIEGGASRLLLLNNDNEIAEADCASLVHAADRRRACVSAVMTRAHEEDLYVLMAGGEVNWKGRGLVRRNTGIRFRPRNTISTADWLPGTALALTSEIFEAVGGFDPKRFPQYRGDADFTLRVRNAGFPCLVLDDVHVVNDLGQTGLNFMHPVPLKTWLQGFWSYRSNFNLRETVRFAFRHCPPALIPFYLTQFYARYVYALWKSHRAPTPLNS